MSATVAERAAAALIVLVGAAGVGAALVHDDGRSDARTDTSSSSSVVAPEDAGSLVGQATGPTVAVYPSSDAVAPLTHLANPNEVGAPLVLLVTGDAVDGRVPVRVPLRPNGTTGWVPVDQLALSTNPYRITIELAAHRLTVHQDGEVLLRAVADVGAPASPTPTGSYFVTALVAMADPAGPYGPYALALSAYSDVVEAFGVGTGVVAIHGTNQAVLPGIDATSGSIRIANPQLSQLAGLLPLGTPVDVVA